MTDVARDAQLSQAIDTIDLWYGELSAGDKAHDRYWHLLDKAEQAQVKKLQHSLQQQRYIEVHGQLRLLLASYINQPAASINIQKTEHGKPYLADESGLAFNLSHSVNKLVVAVGRNCRLGVDIEHIKHRASLSALVDKCFSEQEASYWNALPEAKKTVAFYRFWTRKEAFVKATGRGIALGLEQCVINPAKPTAFLRIPAGYGPPASWRVFDFDLPDFGTQEPEVCAALATDKAFADVRVYKLAAL